MNKAFKKYKKSKWIDTGLSKKHKQRLAFRRMKAAMALSIGMAQIKSIQQSRSDMVSKTIAINKCMADTFQIVGNSLRADL